MRRKKLWLIKYKTGRLQGPLSAPEICQLIDEKLILGEEFISLYPGGRWQAISEEPEFAEYLLEILSHTSVSEPKDKKTSISSSSSSFADSEKELSSATVMMDPDELKKIKQDQKKRSRSVIRKNQKIKKEETVLYELEEDDDSQLDEEYIQSAKTDENSSSSSLPFKGKRKIVLIIGLISLLPVIMLFSKPEKKEPKEYIELKSIKFNQSQMAEDQVELLIKKGMVQYFKSTFLSYLKSQTLLAQAVQGDNKNTYAMALLCMVYLELWPFSKQDSKAMQTVFAIIQKASMLNKGGIRSGLCHSVGLVIKSQYEDAKTTIESSLDGLDNIEDHADNRLTPLFYYLKAKALYSLNDYSTAVSYLDTVQKILPKWVQLYILSADIMLKLKKINSALSMYRKVLKIDPNNKIAQIGVGLLEYKHFKKIQKAQKLLKNAVSNSDKAPYGLLSSAYLVLAQIDLQQGRKASALENARQSYSYNPANNVSKSLVIQLGGEEKLKKTKIRSDQLIYEGDQLVLQNKHQEAVAYYERAFKAKKGGNAVVAVKAAKSLWLLSFSDEAINWLKKAIQSDSTMMESYILMADYYSQMYDFYNAEKILKLATKKSPRSYEVYRGKSILAFRKKDYKKSMYYANQALKIYSADVHSYIILSEIYSETGDVEEALANATRAIEADPNSVKTQSAYAKALGNMYGVDTGVNYFKKLIENYPLILTYQMEMAKYLFGDEQYERAKEVLLEIISIEPKYKEAYFYLGRSFMFEQNYAQAYEAFLQAAILNPSDPKPTFYIGFLRFKEKNYKEAKKYFEKVLALNSRYPSAHYYLGRVAFEQKDYTEAVKQANLETASNPNPEESYVLAGQGYEMQKKYLEGARAYQKALKNQEENTSLMVKTARCYRKAGYIDLAVKILNKAKLSGSAGSSQNMRTGDPQLYKELGAIYEMTGSYREASGAYCNYLNLLPEAPDRRSIKNRMKKLAKLTGKKMKNCG